MPDRLEAIRPARDALPGWGKLWVMRRLAAVLLGSALCAAPRHCPGAHAVGDVQLQVLPAGGGQALPIRRVANITRNCTITYQPIRLGPDARKEAKVTLVLAPAESEAGAQVTVLEPKPAGASAGWIVPFRPGVVAFILGPQGLDERRVANLVTKDEDLMADLADYAEQTQYLEEAVEALAAADQEEPPEDTEVASDRSTPSTQAMLALARALNPVLAAYSPLGAGRRMAPVTLTGRAAVGFFENAGGLIPGGGALSEVRNWLFPDTEFRATFGQTTSQGFTLCAQRQARTRNRMVYLWAYRVVNAPAPALSLARPVHLPLGARVTLPVRAKPADDLVLAGRIREWTLRSKGGGDAIPVSVRIAPQGNALSVDLTRFGGGPGAYLLAGRWDWGLAEVSGDLYLDRPGDLRAARLTEESVVGLIEGSGPVVVRLEGTDFQFVDRVQLKSVSGRLLTPVDLQTAPPRAQRASPQPYLEAEIDTNLYRSGGYALVLAQAGGAPQEIPLRVTPAPPRLDNLPLRVNLGESQQKVVLRGSGLDRIERIESEQAVVRLGPGGAATEREAVIQLGPSIRKGDRIAIALRLREADTPLRVPDAILALGPRPRITGVQGAPLPDLGVALRPGELPAGSYGGFSLRAENLDGPAAVVVRCEGRERTVEPRVLRPGELFFSLDPGSAGPAGCSLEVVVETAAGRSDPHPLGRVVRLPRIESFTLTEEKLGDGAYAGLLRGQDLETIEKTGWSSASGLAVPALPAPTGEGARQILKIALPWPSPAPRSPLYVWLRQETEGRATTARY